MNDRPEADRRASASSSEVWTRWAVGPVLAFQLAVLWLSLDRIFSMSVFCSAWRSPPFMIFNILHYGYALLLLVGIASLFWARARKPYIFLLAVTMLALPVQAWLVRNGTLYCDGP